MEIAKLTLSEKKDVAKLLSNAYTKYKSWNKVANACGISESAAFQMAKLQYNTTGDAAWLKVRAALGGSDDANGWVIADTANKKTIIRLLKLAKEKSMWVPLAEKGGSGKSTATKIYYREDTSASVFRIECRKWGRREFLCKVCRTLGLNPDQGVKTIDELIEMITDFFKGRAKSKPQLIIDQCNSLKPAALTSLIFVYNECEGFLSVVPVGTGNLEKTIKNGVKYNTDGFDELDSRLGRNYIHLTGYTEEDVYRICEANGVTDKKRQKDVFEEAQPTRKQVSGSNGQHYVRVVEDCRRIRRIVEREILKANLN
jgi:hypothetical protein